MMPTVAIPYIQMLDVGWHRVGCCNPEQGEWSLEALKFDCQMDAPTKGGNLEVDRWDGESLKQSDGLSGLKLGWDLNSAFPVAPTELQSCKQSKWKEGKRGAVQCRCQKWPLVPATRSRAAFWSSDGRMAFHGASGRAWRSCQVWTCHTQSWCLAGSGLWKLVDIFSPHVHSRHSQIQESCIWGKY